MNWQTHLLRSGYVVHLVVCGTLGGYVVHLVIKSNEQSGSSKGSEMFP